MPTNDSNTQRVSHDSYGANSAQGLFKIWFWTAVLISIAFVLAFPVNWYFPEFLPSIVSRMQLSIENNLGAWWSGILLFMLFVHAYDAGAAATDRAPKTARAWKMISAVLLFFSADEVGSLHERISLLGNYLGIGGWTLLLPIGAVLGFFLLHAFYTLWQDDDSRRHVVPLFIGFGILGSVAIQEFVEHAIDWGTGALVWIRYAVEEGSELLGMLVLLRVVLQPSITAAGSEISAERRLFAALSDYAPKVFYLLVALVPLFTLLTVLIADHRGRLAAWLTIISFVAAGLVPLGRIISGEMRTRGRYIAIAILCVGASVVTMYFGHSLMQSIGGFDVSRQLLGMAIFCVAIGGIWLATLPAQSRNLKIPIAISVLAALAVPILGRTATYVFFVTQAMAILILWINYAAVKSLPPSAGVEMNRPSPEPGQ